MTTDPPASPGSGPARPTAGRGWVNILNARSATLHADVGGGQGQLHSGDGLVQGRSRHRQQDGQCRVGAGGRRAAGELGAGVPVDGGRPARGGGERREQYTNIGNPVEATDFNSDTLYYSLSGTDAAVIRNRSKQWAAPAGVGRDAGLRGQAELPLHGGSQRPSGPARRRRHGDRRHAERDGSR